MLPRLFPGRHAGASQPCSHPDCSVKTQKTNGCFYCRRNKGVVTCDKTEGKTDVSMCASTSLDGGFPLPLDSPAAHQCQASHCSASACFPCPKQQSHLTPQRPLLAFGASPFSPGRPGSPFEPEAPGIPGHPWRTASRSASPSPTILTSKEMKTVFVEIIRAFNVLEGKMNPLSSGAVQAKAMRVAVWWCCMY